MTAINFKLITRVRKQPITWDGCRDVYSIKDTLQGGRKKIGLGPIWGRK